MVERRTIFIADDHDRFRDDLKGVIAGDERFLLVGEAANGEDAWNGIDSTNPQVVLLDINMPQGGGLEVAERMARLGLEAKVILVTAYKEESLVNRAMELGVKAYVLKDDFVRDLPQALAEVWSGATYLSPAVAQFWNRGSSRDAKTGPGEVILDGLTPSELRVLRFLADARKVDFIAKRLATTPARVVDMQHRISSELGLNDAELSCFASQKRSELKAFKLIPEDFE